MQREIAAGYEIAGFFLDMAFWPTVCLCPACQSRSRQELGLPIPTMVDWRDPAWTAFQRARERWLFEFTSAVTDAAAGARPAQFMTTVPRHLAEHEEVRGIYDLEMIVLSAIAKGAAIRYIDAVDPAGTLNRSIYELLTAVIGGEPVCDVAVFLNDHAKVSESDNGAHCFPSEHFGPECDFPKRQDRLKTA